jgi:glycosyltransferase involved in cell wall biosynthesis
VTSPLKPPSERERLLDRILRVEKVAQSRDREIERLQSLLYGATVGQHLYRAWQVLTGNPHYRRKKLIPKIDPATVSGYHDLLIEGLRVKFHKAALADVRGTGRVARELLLQFQALADASAETPALDAQPVHFFAAPHWGPALLPARSCVVIHDTIPSLTPGYPDGQRAIFENRCREVIGQAEKLITISRTSAHDISRLFGVPLDRLHIIPNGVSRLPVSASTGVTIPAAPFVVYVGGGDSHKNIPVVFEALTRPETSGIHLVMIGDNEFLCALSEAFGIEDRVHFLGRQDDAVVGHVIARSLALVFPSLHEGFGLPPLEAALLEVPSICSRRPAMTEFLENAALFAEPDSPADWARCICELADSPVLRAEIVARGRHAASALSWPRAARSYVDALKATP